MECNLGNQIFEVRTLIQFFLSLNNSITRPQAEEFSFFVRPNVIRFNTPIIATLLKFLKDIWNLVKLSYLKIALLRANGHHYALSVEGQLLLHRRLPL